MCLCAVDECGTCAGSSDCPLYFHLLFDYPFMHPFAFVAGTPTQAAVTEEIIGALALRTLIPPDHFYIQALTPALNTSITDLELDLVIEGGG